MRARGRSPSPHIDFSCHGPVVEIVARSRPVRALSRARIRQFLKRVQKLMQHERVVETFSIFDVDGSGSIDAKELRPVVEMVMPNHDQVVLDEMVASLDINKDGEVDLWEFCVAIQKRTEGISEADMKMEMDEAFNLFNSSEFGGLGDGSVGEEQIRRIMQCAAGTRKQLTDDELESMLVELDKSNLSVRNGATIKLVRCFPIARLLFCLLLPLPLEALAMARRAFQPSLGMRHRCR